MSDHARGVLLPVLKEVRDNCRVTERLLDTGAYQVSVATLWANLVLHPEESGFAESELEDCYQVLSEDCREVLGGSAELLDCFTFLNSKDGAAAMASARLNQTHKDMLLYFASMMIDPDGHRRWTAQLRDELER